MTAADVTSKRVECQPNFGSKEVILISSGTESGGTDFMTLNLSAFGLKQVTNVIEFVHETDYSVIVKTAPDSTVVSSGVLTVVLSDHSTPGDWDDKTRVVVVEGE